MRFDRLPSNAEKGLALALLAGLVLLVGAAVALPLQHIARMDARFAEQEQRLERLRQQASGRDQLETAEAALRAAHARSGGRLEGETANVASAKLQKLGAAVLETRGGTISSSQVLPTVPDGGETRVGVRFSLSIDIVGLSGALYELESGSRLLFVDNLTVIAAENLLPNQPRSKPVRLDVTFDLFGYTKREAAGS
jgi:general secretion pathway protein M